MTSVQEVAWKYITRPVALRLPTGKEIREINLKCVIVSKLKLYIIRNTFSLYSVVKIVLCTILCHVKTSIL